MNTNQEIWKDISGFEGLYQISSHGRLKSFHREKCGTILKNNNSKGDYIRRVLKKDKVGIHVSIHRIVAQEFIPNPLNKSQVNHKDCDRQNNHVENLEWVTGSENIRHAVKMKPSMLDGIIKYNTTLRPKPIYQFDLDGVFIAAYKNSKEAYRATGVCARNILQVANKKEYKPGLTRKQAGGYIWSFEGVLVCCSEF